MADEDYYKDSIKEALKKKIKDKIKKELLQEIYEELKLEEDSLTEEISSMIAKKTAKGKKLAHAKKPAPKMVKKENDITITEVAIEKEVFISVKAILKIASHALKYANSKIPKKQWIEVIGLLAGKIDNSGLIHIEDAYPMGHGNAVYAEIKDYTNYVRAYQDIKKQKFFICGWYHSHPSYGCFMSNEDMGTQARYQKLWDKAVALVIDPYQIDGKSTGFEIYKADIRTNTWYPLVYGIKGSLDIKMLPEILEFMNPIIDGKPVYLEYDE
jgi:proteasome lid subunit RPN8/RPN11